jgi:PadR family transcriptional regulator AphA
MSEQSTVSTTEGAVLGLLAFGERSGYDLARDAETSIGYLWTPSRSQIYKVLPRLVTAGLAHARAVEQDSRPDKALYKLSARGRRALRAWLNEVEDEPASGRVVFPLKLFFCDFASPETALAQLTGYRRFLERRLEQYERLLPSAATSPNRYPHYVLKHGLTRVRSTLAWIEETIESLPVRDRSRTTGHGTPSGSTDRAARSRSQGSAPPRNRGWRR